MLKIKFFLFLAFSGFVMQGQQQVLDKVIGVVAKYPILLSDLQSSMIERDQQGLPIDKCMAFEMLVFQKLLVAQADRDSVVVGDAEIETELTRRMNYFIQQFGSEAKLEEFYGKRTNVLKDELRADIQEQLVAEKMNGKITGDAKLTPAEIRQFYNSIPEDSLPLIESEVELEQLVKKPSFSHEAKIDARETLEAYRQRVIKGEVSISTIARLYSEDPGSAKDGGRYENVGRGVMDPSFEAVAFRLKKGEISNVFETPYGYHFIQLEQRKGELVDLRHVLVMPKMSNEDFYNCKLKLDTIYEEIKSGKITFEDAVKKYSDDEETKQNAGLMINPSNASTRFDNETLSQIDKNLIATINSMQPDDMSKPMQFSTPDGKPGYRILKLKARIDPHKANLKEDYQRLSSMANQSKKKELVRDWIKKRSKITYIKLDKEFACKFENQWTINN
ncbi:peptidylprolyl isomerase [Aurantibacillus circumpalustris]|uniref:peptidylprolyl isomerase n=1 Tax=Aurantibacillus circumpalustris TaxID=3036359 RepID=UPI00295BB22B|nr:peptidylprolyl isomerase [Aurantibacillus circumpalustris]